MATAAVNHKKPTGEETVTFRAFRDSGRYRDDIVVLVNGRTYRIRRGVTVTVPRYVYEVLMASERQDTDTAARIGELSEQYQKEAGARQL